VHRRRVSPVDAAPVEVRAELARQAPAIATAVTATTLLLGLGIATGQANWQVYLVVLLAGGVLVARSHLRVGLSQPTIWGLVLFGVGHVAGGMVPVGDGILYEVWLLDGVVRYDNLQHAVGFGFVGRATWEVLRHRFVVTGDDVPVVAFWIVVLGATGFGAVNEIAEYVLTLTLEATKVGGYDNTARDLVANLTGGVLLGWVTARGAGRARRS
jgi:hypothetical protein